MAQTKLTLEPNEYDEFQIEDIEVKLWNNSKKKKAIKIEVRKVGK